MTFYQILAALVCGIGVPASMASEMARNRELNLWRKRSMSADARGIDPNCRSLGWTLSLAGPGAQVAHVLCDRYLGFSRIQVVSSDSTLRGLPATPQGRVFFKEGSTWARSEEGRGRFEWSGRSTSGMGDVTLRGNPVGPGFRGSASIGAGLVATTHEAGVGARLGLSFLYSDSTMGSEVASFGLQKAAIAIGSAETIFYGNLGIQIPEHRLLSENPVLYSFGLSLFGLGRTQKYKFGLGGGLSIPLSEILVFHPGGAFALDGASSRFDFSLEVNLPATTGFWRGSAILLTGEFGRMDHMPYSAAALSLQTTYWH